MQIAVELKNIHKRFGEYHAINDVSFSIEEGSFFSLLGPSGCGKTTLLRIIAGLEYPSSGQILFNNVDISNTPIEKRHIGMVFQNYALFPHMSVYENIIYGLKIKNVDPDLITQDTQYYLKLMNLTGLEKRLPHELSGGQQQRVALARALITKPFLLLLDEPLSNLDVKLREEIREELMRIKQETEITTLYVTHDQSEALYLADNIAIMKQGLIQQLDSAHTIYHRPKNSNVANFVGEANIISLGDLKLLIGDKSNTLPKAEFYSLRPELINFIKGDHSFTGEVLEYRFYGMISSLKIKISNMQNPIKVFFFSQHKEQISKNITAYFDTKSLIAMTQ
ncbi:MAG: ABC transporter ATP-binding protein [Brevinema sp.]